MTSKHTEIFRTPWVVKDTQPMLRLGMDNAPKTFTPIETLEGELIGLFYENQETAEFAARACNSHYELLEALDRLIAHDSDKFIGEEEMEGDLRFAREISAKAKGENNET